MNCCADLVYDVGMHNGDDTAYYLHKGYRVLAVEANPGLVAPARQRFAREIAAARLHIAPVAIGAVNGEAELFVPAQHDLFGSLDATKAARWGERVHRLRVVCRPFAELLDEHGVPYYLKIDIEGSDRLCLDALVPPGLPRYVSIEMSHEDGDRDIRRLAELGYRGFKCVRQNDLAVIGPEELPRQLRLRRLRARGGSLGLAVGAVRRLRRLARPAHDGAWRFPRGASGRFGGDLEGRWLSAEQMLAIWRALRDIDAELGASGVREWFDVHAALDAAPAHRG